MVFDQAVGLKHIRPNLRAEVYIKLRVLNLPCGLALLLHLKFIKLGAQHAHRAVFVLVLRAFVLAGRDNSRWYMRNADSGIGGVHVLPALAAGAISIHAKVVRFNYYFDGFI